MLCNEAVAVNALAAPLMFMPSWNGSELALIA